MKLTPIPGFGVPKSVKPTLPVITLYWSWRERVIYLTGKSDYKIATKKQLEECIERSRGERLPNFYLPALDPGDIVLLEEGLFWIDLDWRVLAYRSDLEKKMSCDGLDKTKKLC